MTATQQQFLEVIDSELAKQRFEAALTLHPLEEERVPLAAALGRVLSRDIIARVNVPSFDRSNLDGYAVRAVDTVGAQDQQTLTLTLQTETIAAGDHPTTELPPGCAITIATGGMIPRGADAIVMVEHTDLVGDRLAVTKPVSPGQGIAFAGTDVASGQMVLCQGELLSSRETGILAAIGENTVYCWRRPTVAVLSTGNEILSPDDTMRPGKVYDSNGRIIADAVKEAGGIPLELGIAADNRLELSAKIRHALASADIVVLSGGTSKGQGDLSYQVIHEFRDPGVLVHGVALKPGKPICLAATQGKPVVVLPGFPTSAIFTFHEFVAPIIRRLAGLPPTSTAVDKAELAVRVNSEIGRTEFLLVRLLHSNNDTHAEWSAYPIGKGSGSVTTFSHADGFVRIDRHTELLEAGSEVLVQRISPDLKPADLVIIGSHCAGMDLIVSMLRNRGMQVRFISMGSAAGLTAVKRGQCDLAAIQRPPDAAHLPPLADDLCAITGYKRREGLIFRTDDPAFYGENAAAIVDRVKHDPACRMINRNPGSGARQLADRLLDGARPSGYQVQTSNHRAVAAAIQQHRADWGIAVEAFADDALAFLPVQDEDYDFVVCKKNLQKPALRSFIAALTDPDFARQLQVMKITAKPQIGDIVEQKTSPLTDRA